MKLNNILTCICIIILYVLCHDTSNFINAVEWTCPVVASPSPAPTQGNQQSSPTPSGGNQQSSPGGNKPNIESFLWRDIYFIPVDWK